MTPPGKDERAALLNRAIGLKKATARAGRTSLTPRPPDEPPQLGDMQRSLWVLHQLDPTSPAYNLSSAFWLSESLDVEKLERALNTVVGRHRLLRSTFQSRRGTVAQVVHPHTPLRVNVVHAPAGSVLDTAVQEARTLFDLAIGPLVRMSFIEERKSQKALLLLVVHHILADEQSLQVLWHELAVAYEGKLPTDEPPVQFDDYVHWSTNRVRDNRPGELEYWMRRLDPLPDNIELPFETPRRETSSPNGRLLSKTLTHGVQREIRRLAIAVGTTPFVVYSFVFRLLLERYLPGRNIAFATPVSTRSHPAAVDMVGYFLNSVVISTSVSEGIPVEAALRDFSREIRELLSHASVPFDLLAERLAPPRRGDRHPIFQVMFVFQETRPAPTFGPADLEPVALDLGSSKFDLTLLVSEGTKSMELAVEYRTDRFDDVWMHRLLGHFDTLITHIGDDIHRPTADLPMLTAEEDACLGTEWQGATTDVEREAFLPQQILEQSRRSPEVRALSCAGEHSTYAALAQTAGAISRELVAQGVKPGSHVGLFLNRSALLVASVVGTHWAGAAYVPLDPGYPPTRNRNVLQDADVTVVLTTTSLTARLAAGTWSTICVDTLEAGVAPILALPNLSPEAPAYVLYTSGSTGRPKGVVVTHGNLRASTAARLEVYDERPERFLLVPSIAFDSSVAGLFWTLSSHGTLVLPTEDDVRDPRRLARIVAEEEVTTLLCVPSLYAQMLALAGQDLQGLTTAIVAGERCSSRLVREHFRAIPNVRLFNEYGPTEATVWATVHEVTARDADQPVAIGRPIPGVQVDVLDQLRRRVPAGIPGEGWISGRTVAEGYWQRGDDTDSRFVDADMAAGHPRSYRSGDRLAWTAQGQLQFLGREDDQIKLRGFRIEPGEVEAALLNQPGVEEVAVVARAAGTADTAARADEATQLVAFLHVANGRADVSWRADLEKHLPDFMVPSRFVALPELPRLPNGKVDRGQLRTMPLEGETSSREPSPPVSERQQALVSLWEGLLGRSGIGVTDNFFELGGHSLLVVAMTDSIARDHGVSLAPSDVFQHPTVRELATLVERQHTPDTAHYAHLFPIQPGGRGTPFIMAIPHFFSQMLATRFRGERPVYGLRGVSLRPEGNVGRWRTMTSLGEELVDEIERRFPDETYIVAGYSFGATMAVETVRLMEERGLPVHRLYLIAPMPLDLYRVGPLQVQLGGLRKPIDQVTPGEAIGLYVRDNNPLTRRPYRRAWLSLAVRPWRRVICLVGRLRRWVGLPLTPGILYADVRVERFRLHRQYHPRPVRTPTVIFNAEEPKTDAAATWRPVFKGPFTVHDIPDPHIGDGSVDKAQDRILDHLTDLGDPC